MAGRFMRFAAVTAMVGAVIAAGQTSATAAPADGPVIQACGYNESEYNAWYVHCDWNNQNVMIYVDMAFPYWDYETCVEPGTTDLGYAMFVNNAWYTGRLC